MRRLPRLLRARLPGPGIPAGEWAPAREVEEQVAALAATGELPSPRRLRAANLRRKALVCLSPEWIPLAFNDAIGEARLAVERGKSVLFDPLPRA